MSKKLIITSNGQVVTPVVSGVINQNGGTMMQFWKGTKKQYKELTQEQLAELNANDTLFFIID